MSNPISRLLGFVRGKVPTSPIQIISSRKVTLKHSIHIVHISGTEYVLGCADAAGITIIDKRELPVESPPHNNTASIHTSVHKPEQ